MLKHVVSHQTKSHTRQNFTLRRYIALKISPLLCGGSKVRHGNWHNFSPGLLWAQKTKSTYVYFVFLTVLVIEIQMFFEWFEVPTSATQAQPASSPCSNCSQLFFHKWIMKKVDPRDDFQVLNISRYDVDSMAVQ